MRPARRIPGLFVAVFLGLFLIAALSALAWAEGEDGDPKPAAGEAGAEEAPLTLGDLETMMKANPTALWIGLVSRFGSILVGVILLIFYWLHLEKMKHGLLPRAPRIEPPVLFPVGPAVLLAVGAMAVLPASITLAFMGINGADLMAATKVAFIATAAATLPVAAIVLVRHRRLGRVIVSGPDLDPARRVAAQREDVLADDVAAVQPGPAFEAFDVPSGPRRAPRLSLLRGAGIGVWTFCVSSVIVVPASIAAAAFLFVCGVEPEPQALVQEIIRTKDASLPIWVLVFGVVIAPLTEECIFRGLLYPSVKQGLGGGRKGAITSAIIVSAVFALIHWDLAAFLPLFFLALVLAWVYERTASLTAVVVAHAVNNFLSLLPLIVLRG